MKKIIILVCLCLVIALAWWGIGTNGFKLIKNENSLDDSATSNELSKKPRNAIRNQRGDKKNGKPYMSDMEYGYTKVNLPKPSYDDWEFYSGAASKRDFKETKAYCKNSLQGRIYASKKIGNWIRHNLEKSPELTQNLLGTLLELVRDEDQRVSLRAAQTLYRLGDYENVAYEKIKDAIMKFNEYSGEENTHDRKNFDDLIRGLLSDFEVYNDSRFNEVIHQAWKQQSQKNLPVAVDFGYYLERVGKPLPIDYWISRLGSPIGINESIEVLSKRLDQQSVPSLSRIYQSKDRKDKSLKAEVSYTLFKLTNKREYLDYIKTQSAIIEKNFSTQNFDNPAEDNTLEVFAKIKPEEAIPMLKNLKHEGRLIRVALDALSATPDKQATDVIYDSTIDYLKSGQGFPNYELEALVRQNTTYADIKFQELRAILMDPENKLTNNRTWTERDFRKVDFYRKYKVGSWRSK